MDYLDKTFIKALFTADYYGGYKCIEEYVGKVLFSIVQKIKISSYLQNTYRTIDEITGHFGFQFQSKPFLSWALRYLELRGYLRSENSIRYKMEKISADMEIEQCRTRLLKYAPSAEIFIQLVKQIEVNIRDFLEGKMNGGDILFADQGVLNLWNKYFNNEFYGYSVLNYGTSYGISKWFSGANAKSMLEIGSGTSGGAIKVFETLRDNNLLDSVKTIWLTDIAPSLLSMGERNIMKDFKNPPKYEQKILDINTSFGKQIGKNTRFDIIYGINVLHVARDLDFSLKQIHDHLNKNGVFIIGESIRPHEGRPMHHEIIFNLLENYCSVKLDPDLRPSHGYLTKDAWGRFFERAGFKNLEFITELERHDQLEYDIKPLHSLLILKGQK